MLPSSWYLVQLIVTLVFMAACVGYGTSCNTPRALSAHLSRCTKYSELTAAASVKRKKSWKGCESKLLKRSKGLLRTSGEQTQEDRDQPQEEETHV